MGMILEKLPGITKGMPGGDLILTTADALIDLGRKQSLWPMTFGLACCAIEMMGSYAARFDFDRMGVIPRASPRVGPSAIARTVRASRWAATRGLTMLRASARSPSRSLQWASP